MQQSEAKQVNTSIWVDALASAGPPATIIFGSAFDLLEKNREDLGTGLEPALWLLLAAFILWAAGFSLLRLSERRRSALTPALAFLLLGPAWILYQSLAKLSATILVFSLAVVVLPALLALVLARLPRAGTRLTFAALGLAFLVPTLVPFANIVASAPPAVETLASEQSLNTAPNIYHVVFDEFQSGFFSDALNETLRRDFAGFQFFPDSVSTYGRTETALAAIFSGRPYALETAPDEYIRKAFFDPQISLLKILETRGYRTEALLHRVYPGGKVSPFHQTEMTRSVTAGDATSHDRQALFSSLWTYSVFPKSISRRVIPTIYWKQLAGDVLLPSEIAFVNVRAIEAFLRKEQNAASSGRYVFIHLILPHFPYVLTKDCIFEEGRQTGPRAQHGCAISVMQRLIAKLRELNRLNNSIVIFQSDHGTGFPDTQDASLSGNRDIFDLAHVRGRAHNLVLVKPAAIDPAPPLVVSDAEITNLDIAPTILEAAGIARPQDFVGSSLLRGGPPPRGPRYYHMYRKSKRITDGPIKRFVLIGKEWRFDADLAVP
jgi:hypothetical protein